MTATSTTTVVARDDAVRAIAAALADRTAFVVVCPPALVGSLAERLPRLTGDWTAYVDNDVGPILRTGAAAGVMLVGLLTPAVTVTVLVPKTVSAAELTDVLGRGTEIPADGSQDLVLLHEDDDGPIVWPGLFVEALAIVDPRAAAQIRASSLGMTS